MGDDGGCRQRCCRVEILAARCGDVALLVKPVEKRLTGGDVQFGYLLIGEVVEDRAQRAQLISVRDHQKRALWCEGGQDGVVVALAHTGDHVRQ